LTGHNHFIQGQGMVYYLFYIDQMSSLRYQSLLERTCRKAWT